LKNFLFILIGLLIAIQFIPTDKTNPPINDNIKLNASTEVMNILKRACYDCHSCETKWPTYSAIAPISWNIIGHVNDGRKALNYSEWKNIDPKIKIKRLERTIKTVNNGMMPLPNYLRFHEEAILSDADKNIIVEWSKEELLNLKGQ
jgi:hypothetical protein